MGSGTDLSASVQAALVERLRAHPTALVFLAFEAAWGVAQLSLYFRARRA